MRLNACLLFYVKYPEPGQVKTRLAASLGAVQAAAFYRCAMLDMWDTICRSVVLENGNLQVGVCYAPTSAEHAFRAWFGDACRYWPQSGEDLGARMAHSFQQAFDAGFERVSLIGSDLPDLPADLMCEAFRRLETDDAVLGPATDGGYYLIGLRRETFTPDVFRDIPWGTARARAATLAQLAQAGLTVSQLPAWDDVDTYADLQAWYQRNQSHAERAARTIVYGQTLLGTKRASS